LLFESAHAGPQKFLARLQELFFWPTMHKDVHLYMKLCGICQKIKVDHCKKMGRLQPSHIPTRPFETVSLDLITGLPPLGAEEFMATFVIVDKSTKYVIIIPMYDTLDQEGFAKLFMERVVNIYGLPTRIIAN
jgi:hypothetical protein